MQVIFSEEMRTLDHLMTKEHGIPSIVLMENAAEGLYRVCSEYATEKNRFVIMCGVGNNGGDGFALARKLVVEGYHVSIYLLGTISNLRGDAKTNASYFIQNKQVKEIKSKHDIEHALLPLNNDDIIIDALFGTGLSRNIEGLFAEAIEQINNSHAKVISVDIPSGVNADTGQIMGCAVKADFTLTFQYPKPGHFIFPGRDLKGHLRVKKIGITKGLKLNKKLRILAYARNSEALSIQTREHNTHKGTYGTLAIVCASKTMTGAGVLAAQSALKGGVGLLNLCVPECTSTLFQSILPQAIVQGLPSDGVAFNDRSPAALEDIMGVMDALVIGPGLTTSSDVLLLVRKALSSFDIPKVVDANALNLLAKRPDILKNIKGDVVLTPHPKEFMRLTGIPIETIMADPIQHVVDFAKAHQVIVLLKGATTYIANPYGDVAMILTGTPGMAKGGSGDVLSGLIGALMSQSYSAYDSAVLGAYIAGLAGELAASNLGEYSMTPTDTIHQIAKALTTL